MMHICHICNYSTFNKKDYFKHVQTRKHTSRVGNASDIEPVIRTNYYCECGKPYKYSSGLYRHKKNCIYESINTEPSSNNILSVHDISNSNTNSNTNNADNIIGVDMIKSFMKENKEIKSLMREIIQNKGVNQTQIINNTYHSHKTFNLQFFLNDTCKDAMNISDFVDSLQIQLTDLENVGRLGFINGMTNIIVNNLNSLDVTKRPLHCTDKKRETVYVKDENKWEKEMGETSKLNNMIKHVCDKNIKLISRWQDTYPEHSNIHSNKSDEFQHIIISVMGGDEATGSSSVSSGITSERKIIKNVLKEITIDKLEQGGPPPIMAPP
mgnify:CR=1 FL=1